MLVYLLKSIRARWLENLGMIAVFTVVVATGTLIISFGTSMRQLAISGGDASTVVVLSRGATMLTNSAVGKEGYDWVNVRPEIEQRDGTALVSPETFTQTQLRSTSGVSLFVGVRGVDPIAYQVHDKVKVIKGRLPQPGTDEILIGKTLDGVFPDITVGGVWNKHPIVGVFASGVGQTDTEMWMDRQRLIAELGRRATEPFAFFFVKTKSSADAASLVAQINSGKQPLQGLTEPDYLQPSNDPSGHLMRLAVAFSLLLALGAGIAAVNTMYSAVLGRQAEIATLHSLGVRRRRLANLILMESVLLALVGIAVGIGITLALEGRQVSRLWTNHPFEQLPVHIGLNAVLAGLAMGLTVGVAGGVLPGLSIRRMDMRKALG
ncbi:MAG TPA: ABC transporter permease [Kofleriaceae bacterium]